MSTIDQLTQALTDYLTMVEDTTEVTPIREEQNDTYIGQGFSFKIGYLGSTPYTALMISIEGLFKRVYRYTSQKSRFITDKEGKTNTDLFTFSPDEKPLYGQFLKEGSDALWSLFIAYCKDLPCKGYLFNERVVEITNWNKTAEWHEGDYVRDDDKKIYKAIKDVPADTEISDTEYWKEVSALYDTDGELVYFLSCEGKSGNLLTLLLSAVEEFLYAFVLFRWYNMAGQREEAEIWLATSKVVEDSLRGYMHMGTVRRKTYPY